MLSVFKLINRFLGKIKNKVLDLSIGKKIMIYYLILLIISATVSTAMYQQVFTKIISGKVSDISFQMLHSISANFLSNIEIGGEYSKIIAANEEVQDALRNASNSFNFDHQMKVRDAMVRLIGGSSLISSVYIFDNYSNRYQSNKDVVKTLTVDKVYQAPWYDEVMNKRGGVVLKINAGGALKPAITEPKEYKANQVSLIRQINDLNTQKTMGIMIVNIPETTFARVFKSIVNNYDSEVAILDENNMEAVRTGSNHGFNISEFAKKSSGKETNSINWKVNNTEYMVAYMRMPENGWKVVSLIPIRALSKETSIFSLVAIGVILGNSLLLFIGAVIISRLITLPIKKLLKSMKGIEKGEFKRVDIKTGNDEMGMLRDGYNSMIIEIQQLISKIVEDQKMKRKAELDVLQAQIKPHFLYNTFDAISSLALSGKNKDVYTIMKALGTYYRTSLSKGREVITIGEEIDVVVNYLKIQKYRYEDMFSVEYDLDENAKNYKILKLALQPFVENALFHGISPKGISGKVLVSTRKLEDCVVIQIADDGMGMSEDQVKKITNGKLERDNSGFGVWGTIERLKIFYGFEDVVSIESQKYLGTKVTIKIPLRSD